MRKLRWILLILLLSSLTLFADPLKAEVDLASPLSVTFSPQEEIDGYLHELISIIDHAQEKLEIALYGLDSVKVYHALKRASERNVEIRILLENANTDRKKEDGTLSHRLEDLGIDIRYVNKTIHHKFLIRDNSFAVTSSGNWNEHANSIYDENTLYLNDEELVLRYRAEFEHLWQNAREFGKTFPFSANHPDPETLLAQIIDLPGRDAYFTSANYRTYISDTHGPTFAKIFGSQVVADTIVELINQSTQSIYMSANHLRSRPIAEALISKKQEYPGLDIRVYLDGQEYITEEYNEIQIAKRAEELAKAKTPGEIRDCLEKNFYYSYELVKAGIEVRFKLSSFSWHPNTAQQMHHKYAIFDQKRVATGSYNYSYNAETNSMENLLIFTDEFSPKAVSAFNDNFAAIWNTGREEGYYNDLLTYLDSESRIIPLLFPPISLTYHETRTLKEKIANAYSPSVETFLKEHKMHLAFFLKGFQFNYDEQNRVSSITDEANQSFHLDYAYNSQGQVIGLSFQSLDTGEFQVNYFYDEQGNLTQLLSPEFDLTFAYDDHNFLKSLTSGQGTHTWDTEVNDSGLTGFLSTPLQYRSSTVELNQQGDPLAITDADGRWINWFYDENSTLSSLTTAERDIYFSRDDANHRWQIQTNDLEQVVFEQPSFDQFKISTSGTVISDLHYTITEQPEKNTLTSIEIVSGHVETGVGKKASIEYLYDPYDRVINVGDVKITRQPFWGQILSLSCNKINETRTYNEWEELTGKQVTCDGQVYFEANYQYDGLHRLKSCTENILGEVSTYDYTYDHAGRLASVYQNGVLVENYTYDLFGNRTSSFVQELATDHLYDNANRLLERTWQQTDSLRKAEYTYNNPGQLQHIAYKTVKDGSQWLTKERFYDYDLFGNLQSVTWASQIQSYRYDPYDRPIARIQNGKLASSYIYGFSTAPLAELNENGRIVSVFLYADGYTPIVMRKGNIDYYMVSDIRGSVRMVIKSTTGEIRQTIKYDSFGNILEDSNPGYTPFGFAGGLYDPRTGLVRFGTRDYHPESGRWTSEDPIAFLSGDPNFYVYAGNDPINFVDQDGLSRTGTGWKVGDPIDALTREGRYPSWSTVRSRYWKNEALQSPDRYSQENLDRMRRGRAPAHGIYGVSMELHHINGRNLPNPHNLKNLRPMWPWDHAKVDPFRFYTDPTSK